MRDLTIGYFSVWKIYQIWLRYVRLFVRAGFFNSLAPMVEPILYFLTFQYGLARVSDTIMYEGKQIPYIDFLLSGMLPISVMLGSIFDSSYYTYMQICERRLWTLFICGPLKLGEVLIGTLIWYMTRSVFTAFLVFCVGWFLGGLSPLYFLKVLPILVLCALFFSSFGILCAVLVKSIYQINLPVFYFVLPMYALCGGYFPNTNFPPILFWISECLPLTMFVDLCRIPLAYPDLWIPKLLFLVFITFSTFLMAYKRVKATLIF